MINGLSVQTLPNLIIRMCLMDMVRDIRTSKKNVIILFIVTIQIPLLLLMAAQSFSVNIGDPFPSFSEPNNLSSDECFSLGIECGEEFSIDDLVQECIVMEFLNVYCHTCRMQVEVFNDLFHAIEKDPVLLEKACVFGIAVGNSPEEVDEFKRDFGAVYPIVADPEKKVFNLTGNTEGTPHTYILRKEEINFVIDYHAGGVSSMDRYLSRIKLSVRGSFTGTEPGNKAPGYSFNSGGMVFDEKNFAGNRLILYFPADRKFSLEIDTRNTENQIKVLYKILNKFPGITVILFKSPGFSPDLEKKYETPSFYFGEPADKEVAETFASPDKPSIYYINQHGRIAFKGDAITLYNAQNILETVEYKPSPPMNERDVIRLIDERIKKLGRKVFTTEKFIMENGEKIYVTALSPERNRAFLFSRFESKPSLCDVCHDSHFIYVLDPEGKIVDFIPVSMTKKDNILWSEKDEQKIKSLIVGKSIFDNFPFNPRVDAVSTATMTSSLVFESLNQGKEIFGKFKDYQFRSDHWKKECFGNICKIEQKAEQMKKVNKNFVFDDAALNALVSEMKIPGCPQGGLLLVVDGKVLCSFHGFNTAGCRGKTADK